jgi:hypothetical protein
MGLAFWPGRQNEPIWGPQVLCGASNPNQQSEIYNGKAHGSLTVATRASSKTRALRLP